jgi:hypothetical protein
MHHRGLGVQARPGTELALARAARGARAGAPPPMPSIAPAPRPVPPESPPLSPPPARPGSYPGARHTLRPRGFNSWDAARPDSSQSSSNSGDDGPPTPWRRAGPAPRGPAPSMRRGAGAGGRGRGCGRSESGRKRSARPGGGRQEGRRAGQEIPHRLPDPGPAAAGQAAAPAPCARPHPQAAPPPLRAAPAPTWPLQNLRANLKAARRASGKGGAHRRSALFPRLSLLSPDTHPSGRPCVHTAQPSPGLEGGGGRDATTPAPTPARLGIGQGKVTLKRPWAISPPLGSSNKRKGPTKQDAGRLWVDSVWTRGR